MKRTLCWSLLVATITLLGFCNEVRAASFYGKVIEVNDGDLITVYNLNRPIKVRLMGVDAPEPGQPFAEVARQHLKDLIIDKDVTVEYSGLSTNGSIVGKVILAGVDICAQMIRDGAAWFDIKNNSRLSETEREIYKQSEIAAHGEKRGLWQVDPIAPWEWRRMQAENRMPRQSLGTSNGPNRSAASTGDLTTMSLLRTAGGNPSPANSNIQSDMAWARPGPRDWQRFEPAGAAFAVNIPVEGKRDVKTVLMGSIPADFNTYTSVDGLSVYGVVWGAGPSDRETHDAVMTFALTGLVNGMGREFEAVTGSKFECSRTPFTDVSSSGFAGRQYDLSGCTVPGAVRMYTRVEGKERRLIIGVTFSPDGDKSGAKRFLQSFTLEK